MAYQVLARKWRPQAFEAVVGQDHVTRTLKNALDSGRVAHAYLFTGPRGVGKTTTARLLAKALACTARTSAEACGRCPACQDFASGAPVDVMEIDAASNTGVDDIRTLRENVKYAPARSRYKVYVVDEVHMLSGAAFNAFLKTLEEPPAHVVFILATTEPRKIPATVLSRCQRFDFRPIPPEQLVESLRAILTTEAVPFDPSALPMLARAAEGSLRDALSLTDTAIAYGEGTLDEASVARLLGSSAPAQVRAFVEALLGHDGAAALGAIDRAAAAGEDLFTLARDAVETLRRLLVLKVGPATVFADLTPAEAAELSRLSEGVSADELMYLLRVFIEADAEMRRSPHPRVEMEVATVRAARRPSPQALDTLLAKVEEAMGQLGALGSGGARPGAVQESFLPGEGASPARPSRTATPAGPAWSPPSSGSPVRPGDGPGSASSGSGLRGGSAPSASASGRGSQGGHRGVVAGAESAAAESEAGGVNTPVADTGGGRAGAVAPGRQGGVARATVEAAPAPVLGAAPARGAPSSDSQPREPMGQPREPMGAVVGDELSEGWSRVIDEVLKKRALLGAVLQHAAPLGVEGGVLSVSLTASPFHKEMLADRANRELINQAVQRHVPGAARLEVDGNGAAQAGARNHPTVQAAVDAFQGEIVAVRPRRPEEGRAT